VTCHFGSESVGSNLHGYIYFEPVVPAFRLRNTQLIVPGGQAAPYILRTSVYSKMISLQSFKQDDGMASERSLASAGTAQDGCPFL